MGISDEIELIQDSVIKEKTDMEDQAYRLLQKVKRVSTVHGTARAL